MQDKWYVLQATERDERLYVCSARGCARVALPPQVDGEPSDPDWTQQSDVVKFHSPLERVDVGSMAAREEPEGTRESNDLAFEGNDEERHLGKLSAAIVQAIGDEFSSLYVAMDDRRASLFEALAPFEIAGFIDGAGATRDELWRISREQHLG